MEHEQKLKLMKITFPKDLENNEIKNELNQNKKVG